SVHRADGLLVAVELDDQILDLQQRPVRPVPLRHRDHVRPPGVTASRRPSPTKLTASTVTAIAMPGGSHSHGIDWISVRFCASFSMFPQLACGGWTPSPRKDAVVSIMIA